MKDKEATRKRELDWNTRSKDVERELKREDRRYVEGEKPFVSVRYR